MIDDSEVFFSVDDFASECTWRSAGHDLTFNGIFHAAHAVESRSGDFSGVSTVAPVLVVDGAELPVDAAQYDEIKIHGEGEYIAADLQPDGGGLVRIILERV